MVETFFDLDDLETAVAAVRSVSSLPIVALMTFDADGETLAGVSARSRRRAAARARRRGVRREPRRRARRRRCDALARDAGRTAACSRRCRTSASRACPASASSSRTRRRRTSASSRRRRARSAPASSAAAAARRRRRSRRSARRSTRTSRRRARCSSASARRRRRPAPTSEPTQLERLLDEGTFVVSVQLDPPLGANPEALHRDGARRPRHEQGAVRRRERQPARPRAHERDHGLGRDRALHRRRDDPAPDAARHDAHRARVDPPRRACGRRAEHPRGHRRPARVRRLSRARAACTRSTRSGSSSCSRA